MAFTVMFSGLFLELISDCSRLGRSCVDEPDQLGQREGGGG